MLAVLDDPRLRNLAGGACSRRWESDAEHCAACGFNGHVHGVQGVQGVLDVEQTVVRRTGCSKSRAEEKRRAWQKALAPPG